MSSVKREELLRALREENVPWDELRALRVQRSTWKAFLTNRAADTTARKRPVWMLAGALAAAAILLLWLGRARVASLAGESVRPVAVATPASRTMSFDPGSTGVLAPGAEVRIALQKPERFEVSQLGGQVQYDIRHDPARAFVVRVADVTVAVLGTRFSVELGASTVKVSVESGRVRVSGGGRSAEVVTGESVTVQAFHPNAPPADDKAEDLVEEARPANDGPVRSPSSSASPAASHPATVEELLAQADAARAGGRSDEAASALRTLLAKYPSSAQARNAWFTLARVERGRGRHAAAAQAFARCAAFGGTLAGEAAAEEAASWLSAGRRDQARGAAERYLRYYPSGAHAAKMRAILE
jgi:TolA-binding protein